MRRFWNGLREVEWYAVIAILLLATAIVITLVLEALWALAIVLAVAAVVSAVFSHRT